MADTQDGEPLVIDWRLRRTWRIAAALCFRLFIMQVLIVLFVHLELQPGGEHFRETITGVLEAYFIIWLLKSMSRSYLDQEIPLLDLLQRCKILESWILLIGVLVMFGLPLICLVEIGDLIDLNLGHGRGPILATFLSSAYAMCLLSVVLQNLDTE